MADASGRDGCKAGVALVTGSAQGVGLGIARALARAGFTVLLTDVRVEPAETAAAVLRAEGADAGSLGLDVRRAEDWERAVAHVAGRWGRLDVLANNAGISTRGTIESTPESDWDLTMAVNLKGPWLGTRAFLPLLRGSRGTIANVGSTRSTRPMPGLFPYVTSKAALWGMTRQVAVECLPWGITCNLVAPGWVDTPGERLIQAAHGRPEFPEGVQNLTTADDVGEVVAFLASPAGRKVNGVTIYVDSGLSVADDAGMVYLPHEVRTRYHTPNTSGPPGLGGTV